MGNEELAKRVTAMETNLRSLADEMQRLAGNILAGKETDMLKVLLAAKRTSESASAAGDLAREMVRPLQIDPGAGR